MNEFFGEVAAWLTDPANWTGRDGVPNRLWEHVSISALSILIACAVALPAAVILGHTRRGGFLAVTAVNIGRAIPSFGVVALAYSVTLGLGVLLSPIGYWPTLIALVALAMPPMFVNAYTGVREVDPALVETARGMGMTEREVLTGVEIPVALPVLMAGVRTASVQVVATAALGAVVGFGGFGRYIIDGLLQRNDAEVFVGGVFVALLAVLTELGLGWVERRTDPTHQVRKVGPIDDRELAAETALPV
jgi:osmoprotectant transport system permease protein